MKNWKISLIFVLAVLMMSTSVFADKGFMNVGINGKSVEVREVPILVDGVELRADVPSFIYIDRTLVPARFVAENYGAEVDWDKKTQTAIINHNGNKIELPINSAKAKFNGKVRNLDNNSIPRLVVFSNGDARTMVPLAFISDALGVEYGYNKEKAMPFIKSKQAEVAPEPKPEEKPVKVYDNTITDVKISKGSTDSNKVVIESSKDLSYSEVLSNDGKVLTLDISNAELKHKKTGNKDGNIPVNDKNINSIEYKQVGDNIKVIVNLKNPSHHDMVRSKDGKINSIVFVNRIGEVKLVGDSIIIENAGSSKYNTIKLDKPDRLIVDILDASLVHGRQIDISKGIGFIEGIRGSQFSGDSNYKPEDKIVRVVLDLKDGNKDSNIKIEKDGNNLKITPEATLWEYIKYNKNGAVSEVNIKNKETAIYQVNTNTANKVVEVRVPTRSTDLKNGTVYVNDGVVDRISVNRGKDNTIISIHYMRSVEVDVLSDIKSENIKLQLKRNSNTKPQDRLIVIDAGHGGHDPGTSSKSGTKEKDLALELSKKTEVALKDKGYNVLMTRDNDKFIPLYDRSGMANDNNADLFVSYHLNSAGGIGSANGIETLYCPAGRASVKKNEDQSPFAKMVQDELIKETGATNRGIKSRPDLAVLRTTKMPAVLIEAGFLSNSAEEAKLKTDSYQNKIVDAVVKAIVDYLKIY